MLYCWECEGEIDGVSDCHPFCSAGCEEDYDARFADPWDEDDYDGGFGSDGEVLGLDEEEDDEDWEEEDDWNSWGGY